jgi:hypothetical protein
MGLIKEPKGVDLIIGPSILTNKDKQFISSVIADYKMTGKLPPKSVPHRGRNKRKKSEKL